MSDEQAAERIIRIPAGPEGGDPLVGTYLETNKTTSAWRVISWPWIAIGFLVSVVGGFIGDACAGDPRPLGAWAEQRPVVQFLHTYLGNPSGVILGMVVAALICAVAARVVKHRGIPATHEPLISLPFALLAYLVCYDWLLGISVLTGAVCIIYLVAILFRIVALLLGGASGLRTDGPAEPEGGWPVYTILVPLYKETAVASKILHHLEALDYPADKLDVKFLLEADDPDTLAALEGAGLPEWAEVIVVPDAQPKTKPRACNHGLERARGTFLVIFDAEDRPEPDQLKQAVWAFSQVPERVVCLQAHLAYHNNDQNLLTRWFALEYNVWFRRYLRGLVRLGSVIPLGGTSNHFRIEILRECHGWDPFNVTEDCDLGVRIHAMGKRTAILESITWEEANSQVGNWLRQRSRWLKGYLATHFVWMRRPAHMLGQLNPYGLLCFFVAIFGVAGLAVLNLPLWIALAVYGVLVMTDMGRGYSFWEVLSQRAEGHQRDSWPMVFDGPDEDPTWQALSKIFFAASAVLLFANFAFIAINVLFGRRQNQDGPGMIIAGLISPLYWVLISLAAWKALWQLIVKPHYWEKTVHGLDTPGAGDDHEAPEMPQVES